jgi:hypothetical protein
MVNGFFDKFAQYIQVDIFKLVDIQAGFAGFVFT